MHQRLRRRLHVDTLGDQLVQQFGRDVLMVEGQRVGAGRDPAQVFEIGVRADHHIGADLRGGLVGRGGQHPQGLPQRDRGLMGHPRQLTAPDHGHDGLGDGLGCTRHGHHGVTASRLVLTGGEAKLL